MTPNDKEKAFHYLLEQTKQQSANISSVDRLAGTFSHAIFQAFQAELRHEEMIEALTIGHYLGSKASRTSPDYPFMFAQLEYWEAVYAEAEQYWLRRYRGDTE